jgi:hypothetical protein
VNEGTVDDKPKTIDEYMKWLHKNHGIVVSKQIRTHYETVSNKVSKDFLDSAFWKEFSQERRMRDFDEKYKKLNENYPLVAKHDPPELVTKSFDSFFLKTYRQNIINNNRWPDPPEWFDHEPGWLLPGNWLTRINDVVRTCFVVRYIDGVKFLVDQLKETCHKFDLSCRSYFVSGEDGYYAAHLYLRQRFEVSKISFDTELIEIEIELQITTQLQEVIRRLLHTHYEERRKRDDSKQAQWQWEYKSDEFATNYLGHILHFVEGMIVEVRDRKKGK